MADSKAQKGIERLLFETGAIRVAPENKPFWYTSGALGPYYSNTQNLIGGEAEANGLLAQIDDWLNGNRLLLPSKIIRHIVNAYNTNTCYRSVAGYIKSCIKENIDIDGVDIISGGARRDWFFSYITAYMFNKPHITIFKDQSMAASAPFGGKKLVDTENSGAAVAVRGGTEETAAIVRGGAEAASAVAVRGGAEAEAQAVAVRDGALRGMRCLHVSDIITTASSYEKSWAPALIKAGTRIHTSLTILDRMQGGAAVLESLGIRHVSVARLDRGFFGRALKQGYIDGTQYEMLLGYIDNPDAAMRTFINNNPNFLKDALSAGGKEAERARMCIDSGIYAAGV